MDYTLEIVTPPSVPDGWLGRVKRQLRVEADETYEDALINDLLIEAIDYVGDRSDISLLATTYKLTLPRFPRRSVKPIYLPRPPLVSIGAIEYTDTAGSTQTLAAENYDVSDGQVSLVHAAVGSVWPSVLDRESSVRVTYTSGGTCPNIARRAVFLLVGHWFLYREDSFEKRLENIPHGVDALIYQLQPGDEFRKPIDESDYPTGDLTRDYGRAAY